MIGSKTSGCDPPVIEQHRQRRRHLMPPARALHDLPPPLQTDQRQMRLRRHLARAGEFVVESV